MARYALLFSPDARMREKFTVPEGKVVYLVRSPVLAAGRATVQDLLSYERYVLQDGVTVCRLPIRPGEDVSLVFIERTHPAIALLHVEVVSPRE